MKDVGDLACGGAGGRCAWRGEAGRRRVRRGGRAREESLEKPDLFEDVEVAVVARLKRSEAFARVEQLFGALLGKRREEGKKCRHATEGR